ncbi:MAG: hypothetical protein EOP56_12050 [Sphingobacteriales bacterium]|nr:MAG: hypothetical protein EOP56_12050 [Sphingobacteriales bacterium]
MSNRNQSDNSSKNKKENTEDNTKKQSVQYDQLAAEDEKTRTKKPGSQSNSSKTHNNGRGGGK